MYLGVVLIWVDGWQLQCCGHSITVGSAISCDCAAVDRSWLSAIIGADQATRVDYMEEHHDGYIIFRVRGVVRGVDAVCCSYDVDPLTKIASPISDSSSRQSFETVSGHERGAPSKDLVGYLVTIDVTEQ